MTPTIDQHSIKVDGTGAATITDLGIELLPNTEDWDDVYPPINETDDESDTSSDEEVVIETQIGTEIDSLKKEAKRLVSEQTTEEEKINSAAVRLSVLDKYPSSMTDKQPETIQNVLSIYKEERVKIFSDHTDATNKLEGIREQIKFYEKKLSNAEAAARKANLKKQKDKAKELAKKQQKKAKLQKERERIRLEREKFWPKKIYQVTINIEASEYTPTSSRRGSTESLTTLALPQEFDKTLESKTLDINLSISYITFSASWSPRYDLSIDSVSATGVLDYSAELSNTTSESWQNTKITLSTSQTTYQGLEDTIPVLQPWHVRLGKSTGSNGALVSTYEQKQLALNRGYHHQKQNLQAPRAEIFGMMKSYDDRQGLFGNIQGLSGGNNNRRERHFYPRSPSIAQAFVPAAARALPARVPVHAHMAQRQPQGAV